MLNLTTLIKRNNRILQITIYRAEKSVLFLFCKQDNFIKEKKYKDVYWTLPHQKRHFGTTTIGSDNLIRALSEDNKTVMDIYNLITSDPDAKEILKKFIDAGYKIL